MTSATSSRFVPALVAVFAAAGARAAVHEGGGLREPVAAVERTVDGRFDVAVSALAVTAFDAAKNDLENKRLARRLAEWGLWREFGAPTNRMLSVAGLVPVSFGIADGRVEAEFSAPTNGVALVAPSAGEPILPIEMPDLLSAPSDTNAPPFAAGFEPFAIAPAPDEPTLRTTWISDPTNFIAPLF